MAPPSRAIPDTLNANQIQLEHLLIYLDESSPIEETFNFVKVAQSCSTVSSFVIESADNTDTLTISRGLVAFGAGLKHVTHLSFQYYLSDNTTLLFVDIVQNLTTLEKLGFGTLAMIDGADLFHTAEEVQQHETLFYSKISNIQPCRIKSMKFTVSLDINGGQDVFKKSNRLFDFIFLSCPMLERFDSEVEDEDFCAFGAINLDFRRQLHLKQVKIQRTKCRRYTFYHEFGKCWQNINVPIHQETATLRQARNAVYHVNLAWDTSNNKIEFELSNCVC